MTDIEYEMSKMIKRIERLEKLVAKLSKRPRHTLDMIDPRRDIWPSDRGFYK